MVTEAARRTTTTTPAVATTPTTAATRVMCGRVPSTAAAETSSRPPHPPPSPAAAGDSLTHAFLSKRRVSPSRSMAVSTTAFTPVFSMNGRASSSSSSNAAESAYTAALASLRGYAAAASAPPAPASSTPLLMSQSSRPSHALQSAAAGSRTSEFASVCHTAARDANGSAQALLALMETQRRGNARSSAVMKQEHGAMTATPPSSATATAAATVVSPSPSMESTTSSRSSFASSSMARTKREHDDDDADASDADSVRTEQSAASSSADRPALKRKFRKATHTVRKEEKAQLELELAALEARMRELKRRALGCDDAQTPQEKLVANAVLRDALQQQLAHFADAQVLFSEYGMTQVISPISMRIRLGRDRSERLATLTAMKEKKFALSRAFLARRCGALDPRKPYCEDQRFETPSGDYCAVRFSVLQFEGVQSVQQVFDILRFYFCNIEISISEKLGNITIREDDDMQDATISQNRLVGTTARGVLLESNTIMFSEYFAHGDGSGNSGSGEYALLSAEFVDDDALYPYRPEQRVRKDVNAILQLTSYRRMVRTAFGEDVEELVVVLTRWSHSRLRRPEFVVPNGAMHEMRENMERWGESMHRIMRETLYPDA